MTVDAAEVPPSVLRGSPSRISNFKEAFQIGLMRSIAAASGAVISGNPEIDEGVDLNLTHRSAEHIIDAARLEVQLKATHRLPSKTGLSVALTADRYEYLRAPSVAVGKILVVMSVPSEQDRWVHVTAKRLKVRHAAYWVNLEGGPAATGSTKTVTAPVTQIFDDIALCAIMARIGQGGRP